MKPLKMHCSNFRHTYDPVIDPLSPTCSNCEFMPDKECGWGYNYLDECVFQVEKGTPYILEPTYDMIQEKGGNWGIMDCGKIEYYNKKWDRLDVVSDGSWELVEYIKNAEIIGMNPYWSSEEEMYSFYNNSWERRQRVKDILKDKEWDIEHGWQWDDYLKWSFKNEPCSLCGKVTKEFMVFGFRARCKTSPVIKVCTGCIGQSDKLCEDDNRISFDELLIYGE